MMTIISLLLLASLLPNLTFTAHVNVGIVHGKVAKSRPYMVSIQLKKQHICGGFLISDQWVLTAAHCWNRQRCQELTVVVGTPDLGKNNILNRIMVKDCIPHPGSTTRPYRNDIMLLKLSRNVRNLNNHVQWISLPKKDVVASNLDCSVAGWGRLSSNGPLSARLMEANVFIKNHKECHRSWGNEYIDSQMICVYGSGGSCEYDSGGPLVCGNTAVGITSFGDISHCNSPVKPNVYTKISAFLPWIHQTIRNVK